MLSIPPTPNTHTLGPVPSPQQHTLPPKACGQQRSPSLVLSLGRLTISAARLQYNGSEPSSWLQGLGYQDYRGAAPAHPPCELTQVQPWAPFPGLSLSTPSCCVCSLPGLQTHVEILTTPARDFPFTMSTNWMAISSPQRLWASLVLAPRWGQLMTFSWSTKARSRGGSCPQRDL